MHISPSFTTSPSGILSAILRNAPDVQPLRHASALEAAGYALKQIESIAVYSAAGDELRGSINTEMKDRWQSVLDEIGMAAPLASFLSNDDFLKLTNAVAQRGVADDSALALHVARKVIEAGYPHPIEVKRPKAQDRTHVSFGPPRQNMLLKLFGPSGGNGDSAMVDIFVGSLSVEDQARLIGRDCHTPNDNPARFARDTINQNLFVPFDYRDMTFFRPVSELRDGYTMARIGTLQADAEGHAVYRSHGRYVTLDAPQW